MLRATSWSESFFSVAGFICGPLPSWSIDPDPAINSATGGLSTPAGVVRTASMGPTVTLLSSAQALAAKAATKTTATRAARMGTLINLARLFRQHDRDAVADRIGEFRGARDQLLLRRIVFERAFGHRADQDFQQLGVDGVFRTFRCGCHVRWAPASYRLLAQLACACRLDAMPSASIPQAQAPAASSAAACPRGRSQ